jgi:hypothetical protein
MSKELVESIVVDDADAIVESFNAVMAEKIADALEVRRVELASGIMDEAVVVHDKDGNPVGRYKNIETAKLLKPTSDGYKHSEDDGLSNKYSGKYPGGNKQKEADKAAFMKRFAKEEAEQVDEVSKNLLGRYGSKAVRAHLAAKSAGDTGTANKRAAGVNLASAKSFPGQYKNSPDKAKVAATNEEAEQIDEVQAISKVNTSLKRWNKYKKNAATKKVGYPTAKMGANAAESGVNSLKRGREMLRQEEAEQVAEDMTDSAKLSVMKTPNKAAALTALARYKKVGGDINKLSPGHRSLVAGYLEKAGGIGSLGNSIQRKVLKPQ